MILKSYSVLRKVNILFIFALISLFVFPPVTTVNSSQLSDEDLLSSNYIEKNDEIKVGEVFKGRVISTQEKNDLSKIAINVNKAELIDNKTNLFEQFDETHALTVYTESDGSFSFERPSKNISISIDLATLPKNYGVSKKTQFCMDYMNEISFNIYAIYDVELGVKNHQLDNVNILSKEGIKLFANYETKKVQEEITEYNVLEKQAISYQISVNVYDETYSYDGKIDLSKLTYWDKLTFLEDSKVITKDEKSGNYEKTPEEFAEELAIELARVKLIYGTDSFVISDSGRFKIHYLNYDDSTETGITDLAAEDVADKFDAIHTFFCENITTTFKTPVVAENDYFNVYISTNVSPNSGEFGINSLNFGYIGILENLVWPKNDSGMSNDRYIHIAAHEYFHAITNEYFDEMLDNGDGSYDYTEFYWLNESLSDWAGMEYIKSLGVQNLYAKNYFTSRTNGFLYTKNTYLLTTILDNGMFPYYSWIFHAFIVEKYQVNVVKELLETFATEVEYSLREILESTLSNYDIFKNVFLEFTKENINPSSNYTSIDYFYKQSWANNIEKRSIHYTGEQKAINKLASDYTEIIALDTPNVGMSFIVEKLSASVEPLKVGLKLTYPDGSGYPDVFQWFDLSSYFNIYIGAFDRNYLKSVTIVFANYSEEEIDVCYSINQIINSTNVTEEIDNYNIKDRYYKDQNDNYIYLEKFIPNSTDLYEFDLQVTPYVTMCNTTLEILNSNLELIKKNVVLENSPNSISTNTGINYRKIITYLDEEEVYYIRSMFPFKIIDPENSISYDYLRNNYNLLLTIRPVDNEENYIYLDQNEYYNSGNEIVHNDNMKIIQIEEDGLYDIRFNRILGGGINIFILKKNLNGTYDILYEEIINQYDNVFGAGKYLSFFEDDEIYIGYLKNDGPTNSVIKIEVEKIQVPFDVILDPATAIYKGTEVTMNGGTLLGTNIETGYTRHAYLTSLAPHQSRLQYNWYSSDESVAKVSEYGTIIACSPGKVFITAVYKTDSTQVGYVVVTVTSAVPPLAPNDFNYITLITDNRDNPLHNGTMYHYYPEEDNDIIYVGYTRAICIDMGNIYSPTSPTKIIQYFNWASSNSSIATIDEFGNITGISQGNVVIMGEYKFNEYYIGGLAIHITIE